MTEFTDRYYPTVCIRRAEMRAMEHLPVVQKKKMLPIVLLAPWLNSNSFDKSIERLEKSVGNIPVIVDLDRHYRSASEKESRIVFRKLLNDETSQSWIDLVTENENYIPCIQFYGIPETSIQKQISTFNKLGRGVVLRIEIERLHDYQSLATLIEASEIDDLLIVIDAGWSELLEIQTQKATNFVNLFSVVIDNPRFVITTSNFPNNFSNIEQFDSVSILSRQLFSEVKNRTNYEVFYGDWASTKPRKYDGFGRAPLPRIDFPTFSKWIIARSKANEWTFQQAAKRITEMDEWSNHPKVWGAGMIEKTANRIPGAITTGPESIACRVNIHLFVQNNFDTADLGAIQTDEPWTDPI